MQHSDLLLKKLIDIVKNLRSDKGCPWDKKQTPETLTKYIIEETNELLAAIKSNDPVNICEESGDVLFLLVILAEIYSEKNIYNFDQTIQSITEKLIRRHPHVFSDSPVENEEELRQQWEDIKAKEKLENK
ncbi:MAG: nucleotide pyrophosphohydrolase [Bacteroidetes bacterium]|nr:nucleotide pyrophosphohydrolase [Bacteroidota bacterium]